MIAAVLPLILLQLKSASQDLSAQFVIDSSRPYVYLAFDHIGPRKPTREHESALGLWLKLVNNCRVPITINTYGLITGDPGVGVFYEVIPLTDFAVSSNLDVGRGGTDTNPLGMPVGNPGAELSSSTVVPPGTELLLGVPLNSVSPRWFMRVKVALKVGGLRAGPGPYTELDFFETQMPRAAREKQSHDTQPPNNGAASQFVSHEVGHAQGH